MYFSSGSCSSSGFIGDGGQATAALLSAPACVLAFMTENRVMFAIADSGNARVRMVFDGVIDTVAGSGSSFRRRLQSTSSAIGPVQSIARDNSRNIIAVSQHAVIGLGAVLTLSPTPSPTPRPSSEPTSQPSTLPSNQPTRKPSRQPSDQPSKQPSFQPFFLPSSQPSFQPSRKPSKQPSFRPSSQPSSKPSNQPSYQPTFQPFSQPTSQPSFQPSSQPSSQPSLQPTFQPSCKPTSQPSSRPSPKPSPSPTPVPTLINAEQFIVSRFAGGSTPGNIGDGSLAVDAQFNSPSGVAFDTSNNIYIADTANNCIRKVTALTGVINTVVGINGAVAGYSGDGSAATSASLNGPIGVAVDSVGNIIVTDTGNNCVRFVSSTDGAISTIAGRCGQSGVMGAGVAATTGYLNSPRGVAVNSNGTIYFAETHNHKIRSLTLLVNHTQLSNANTIYEIGTLAGDHSTCIRLHLLILLL